MTNLRTFENFLMDAHSIRYIGTDDDMPDDFDRYMENLEPDHLIEMAQKYGNMMYKLGGGK